MYLKCTISLLVLTTIVFGAIDFKCPSGKKCMSLPDKCTNDCMGTVSLKAEADGTVHFVVQTKPGLHTTIGLSTNELMEASFGVACSEDNGILRLQRIWIGPGRTVVAIPESDTANQIFNQRTDTKDEIAACRFGLKLPISYEDEEFKTDSDIFILIASSPSQSRAPFITTHDPVGRKVSNFKLYSRAAPSSTLFAYSWILVFVTVFAYGSKIFCT